MAKAKEDQHSEICFCVRQGCSRAETRRRLQAAHPGTALSDSQINRWYAKFLTTPNLDLKDAPWSHGKRVLTPTKVAQIQAAVDGDRRRSVKEIANIVQVSHGSVHTALKKDLQLSRRPAKWVPHLLTPAQKARRVMTARAALQFLRRRGRHPHVITGDKSWFWTWTPESKRQSSVWIHSGEDRPQKPRIERSTPKMMLIVFFDTRGVVLRHWVPNGQGVDRHLYRQVMEDLREAVRRRCPDVWRQKNWCIHHDNAPAHCADLVQNFLRQHGVQQVPHPGYSPDISPCDYFLFDKVKKMISGTHYQTKADLCTAVDAALDQIPQEMWAQAMDNYPIRLHKVIASGGGYFE